MESKFEDEMEDPDENELEPELDEKEVEDVWQAVNRMPVIQVSSVNDYILRLISILSDWDSSGR